MVKRRSLGRGLEALLGSDASRGAERGSGGEGEPELRNVPVEGVYNWDPGAHFGIYQPDTFWWDNNGKAVDARAAR